MGYQCKVCEGWFKPDEMSQHYKDICLDCPLDLLTIKVEEEITDIKDNETERTQTQEGK